MTDEEIVNEEEMKHRGVYLREGRYVAADYDGPDGLVTMVGGESIADDLAAKLNAELEGETMATKKNGKKTLAAKPKAEKKARVAKPRAAKKVRAAGTPFARLTVPTGMVLRRTYKGKDYEVKALTDSFTMNGDSYGSLTAVAMKITGYKAISGPVFFKNALAEKGVTEAA